MGVSCEYDAWNGGGLHCTNEAAWVVHNNRDDTTQLACQVCKDHMFPVVQGNPALKRWFVFRALRRR